MAYAYDGKYFLSNNGITTDFNSYVNTNINGIYYERCKNNNKFLYSWRNKVLSIANLSTAKVIHSINVNSILNTATNYGEVCYDESKNMAVCVIGNSDEGSYVCIIHFSNNSIDRKLITNSNLGGDNHINLIGSTIIYANSNSNFFNIYDYYANIYYKYDNPNIEYRYYDALIVNNNLYASCFYRESGGGHVNDILIAITYPFDGHDSSKYYQIRNRNKLGDYFVKIK